MSTYFWFQPANLMEDDYISHNGSRVELSIERGKVIKRIYSTAEKVLGKNIPWYGNVGGKRFMKGSLKNVDEKGRTLTFMFLSEELSDGEFRQKLEEELKNNNLQMDDATLRALEKYDEGIRWGRYTLTLIVLMGLLTALFLYTQTKSNDEPQAETVQPQTK